ncbi:MAG: hypothetical protein HKN26_13505 [Acidimicrobiales bacterium]|nr:hypothetical protein [Acidimicrobiales bacterium]
MTDETPTPPPGDGPDPQTEKAVGDALRDAPTPEHGPEFWAQLDHQLGAEPTGASVFDTDDAQAPAAPYEVAPAVEYAPPHAPEAPTRRTGIIAAVLAAAAVLIIGLVVGISVLGDDPDTELASDTSTPAPTNAPTTAPPLPSTSAPATVPATTVVDTTIRTSTTVPEPGDTWTVLAATIDGGGQYVAIDRPTDPGNTETLSVQLGVVRDGEITRTYPITTCGIRLAEGPQGALTVVTNCEESFEGMWIGTQLGAEVRSFTPITLTPRPSSLWDVAWDLTNKVMVGDADVPGLTDGLETVIINSEGTVTLAASTPADIEGRRVVAEVMQYDFIEPSGWISDVAPGFASVFGAGEGDFLITTRYDEHTTLDGDLDNPLSGIGAGETVRSDRSEPVPLWTPTGELSGTEADVRKVVIDEGNGVDRLIWVYDLADRTIEIWTRYEDPLFNGLHSYEDLFAQVRVYETSGDVAPPTACSASDLDDPGPDAGLPDAVQEKRAAIIAAARACNIPALAALTAEGFTVSFGGGDAESFWIFGEYYTADPDALAAIVRHLAVDATPAGDPVAEYVWPGAHTVAWPDVTPEMLQQLRDIGYTDDDLDFFEEFGGYIGLRLGITVDGEWAYSVAGD